MEKMTAAALRVGASSWHPGKASQYFVRKSWTMVVDHSKALRVDSMAISKFKATCLAALERVRVTGRPLRITRFGKPVADIIPPAPDAPAGDWMGSLRGTVEIRGDIVGPTGDLVRWDARK